MHLWFSADWFILEEIYYSFFYPSRKPWEPASVESQPNLEMKKKKLHKKCTEIEMGKGKKVWWVKPMNVAYACIFEFRILYIVYEARTQHYYFVSI